MSNAAHGRLLIGTDIDGQSQPDKGPPSPVTYGAALLSED